jgi:hypothetical protein
VISIAATCIAVHSSEHALIQVQHPTRPTQPSDPQNGDKVAPTSLEAWRIKTQSASPLISQSLPGVFDLTCVHRVAHVPRKLMGTFFSNNSNFHHNSVLSKILIE